ncbi:MAG: DJ-1/PfpI family protein [Pseudomonadota bacterium]
MKIGFLLFDSVTQLDMTGPLQFLSRLPDADAMTIAKEKRLIETDCPMAIMPTHGFDDAPPLDMICVPGGFGVVPAIRDAETIDFVKTQGANAEYVTSVCTGALILGAAGLLTGKRATTHWAYTSLLALFGATHTPGRVVRDGNTFTGGGVTAGIDFALTVAAALHGDDMAQTMQLGLEYDPHPPFNAGTPDTAPSAILDQLNDRYEAPLTETKAALEAALNQ